MSRETFMYIVASDADATCVGYIKADSEEHVRKILNDELVKSDCDPKYYSIEVIEIRGERKEFIVDGHNISECFAAS